MKGDEPIFEGFGCYVNDGVEPLKSYEYKTPVGGATTVIINDTEKLVYLDFDILLNKDTFYKISFFINGLHDPKLQVNLQKNGSIYTFDSEQYAPKLFEDDYAKYLKNKAFDCKVGKLAIERMREILRYEPVF